MQIEDNNSASPLRRKKQEQVHTERGQDAEEEEC